MKLSNTSERLKYLMETRKLKQVDILSKCEPYCKKYNIKMGKSDLSQYVSGKTEPAQRKLTILGLALDVNEAWLMGYDTYMERKTIETNHNLEIAHEDNNLQHDNKTNYVETFKAFKLWQTQIGHHDFTEEEIKEIIDFTKYIISKRGDK